MEGPESSESEIDFEPSDQGLKPADVRESIRQSFKRDFIASEHMGDAEIEALNIELEKEGGQKFSLLQVHQCRSCLENHVAFFSSSLKHATCGRHSLSPWQFACSTLSRCP